jgi:hypothetical protein
MEGRPTRKSEPVRDPLENAAPTSPESRYGIGKWIDVDHVLRQVFAYGRSAIASLEARGWGVMILICVFFAAGISLVFHQSALPPGGDPGNWIATSYAYIGRPVPSQVTPLAYSPIVFLVLGAAVIVGGGPIAAAKIIAPILVILLGVSIFYLARTIIQSRILAIATTTFLLLDPQLLQMLFWGAYPNVLAFVFMNLALASLIQIGYGRTSRGVLLFWIFFAATILTHTLTGLILGFVVAVAFFLSLAVPLPPTRTLISEAKEGKLDSPQLMARVVSMSKWGRVGLVTFVALVGGYYVGTYLVGIPHPNYFTSNPLAFEIIGLGTFFQGLLPGFTMTSIDMIYFVSVLIILIFGFFGLVIKVRKQWVTTAVIVLFAWILTILFSPLGGWALRIVTDYHRLGFFLVIPLGLSIAYILDRTWASAPLPGAVAATPVSSTPVARGLHSWRRPNPQRKRALLLTGVVLVLGLLFLAGITIPGITRAQRVFTRVGHDSNFLQAIRFIQSYPIPGGILTVPGADKWTRAMTDRNAFAPYGSSAYLFFQSQIIDSNLAYYGLVSHYAITNGLVSSWVRATNSLYSHGVPEYGAYVAGTFHPSISFPSTLMSIDLTDPGGPIANTTINLTGNSQVFFLPGINGNDPMNIQFLSTRFSVSVTTTLDPVSPSANLTFTVTANGPYRVHGFRVVAIPTEDTSALVWPAFSPGSFNWQPIQTHAGPVTVATVSPVPAFQGVTSLDPSTGTPAALMYFTSSSPAGSSSVTGSISLYTPTASTLFHGLPTVLSTPSLWGQLGVRLVLMRNSTFAANPSVAFPDEIPWLVGELHCQVVYQNAEWTVLRTPLSNR